LTAELDHRNLVRTLGFEELDGEYLLVLELVRGRDLRALLRDHAPLGPPPPGVGAFIVAEVCRGLAHAHARGLVHRDVTPSNILVSDDGAVKLSDFGLGRALASPERLTRTGVLVGSLPYMAPEQLAGGEVDARAD